MQPVTISRLRPVFLLLSCLALFACGGGGGGSDPTPGTPGEPSEPMPPLPPPGPEPLTNNEATRFLSQATFGPSEITVDGLLASNAEDWLLAEFDKPASLHLDTVLAGFGPGGEFRDDRGMPLSGILFLASDSFWETAISADDQLRQRLAFALSQILVVSAQGTLGQYPQSVAHYADILTTGAFGNYRDLLKEVTYSPAMATYLTYLRNEKADPLTNRVPDENYARELLQLFTLGLVELNPDGTPVLNSDGSQRELYDNSDITEFAKVFTGLSFEGIGFNVRARFIPLTGFYTPLVMFDEFHSMEAKNFLDTTIPAGTGGVETIDLALDAIFSHPNVGPFLGRQLIQRFVTSAPTPAYVSRVTAAFNSGSFQLPSGTQVGTGERGDLKAVIAAVLFDQQARDASAAEADAFGKLREPILRFTHWARTFKINSAVAANELLLKESIRSDLLGQQAYRSPSVFNFYRPGYLAPGSETAAAGLTAPELQITTASTIVGYPNFMVAYALGLSPQDERGGLVGPPAYRPDYSTQAALAGDLNALLDNLDLLLTHGALSADTRSRITDILSQLPGDTEEGRLLRAQIGSVLVMTAPEYIVQR